MTDTPTPGPSEQQPKETAPAFEAFRTYLEMGPSRSLAKVGRALGKSKTLMDRWSTRWRWAERVREFEGQATGVRDAAHLDALAARSKRQAEIAQLHGEASALVAMALVRKIQENEKALDGLAVDELVRLEATIGRMHNRAVMTERLALGLTTSQAGEDVSAADREATSARLTDDELEARLTGVDELAEARRRRRKKDVA